MHIITGILLARLMQARQKTGEKGSDEQSDKFSPLFSRPDILSLEHSLPSRTRFKVPALKGSEESANSLQNRLEAIESVSAVKVSSVSGSVIIEHSLDGDLRPELLAAAIMRLLGLEKSLEQRPSPLLASEFRDMASSLNRAVYMRTRGLADLKTLILLALLGVGIKGIIDQRRLSLPAGFTLLWWAGHGLLHGENEAC